MHNGGGVLDSENQGVRIQEVTLHELYLVV